MLFADTPSPIFHFDACAVTLRACAAPPFPRRAAPLRFLISRSLILFYHATFADFLHHSPPDAACRERASF